ncbi:hypothetical protein ABG067_002919 [Albugo candida]
MLFGCITTGKERKKLALNIARVEKSGCASTEDLKSLQTWKRLLREKNELIRTLQAKVSSVEKHNLIPDELFPSKEQICHFIIECLLGEAIGGKATNCELKSCKEDLRETKGRLVEALEDLDDLRDNAHTETVATGNETMQANDVKGSQSELKKSTKGPQKTKTYTFLSEDGLEDSLSEVSRSDHSDRVEGEASEAY